ncbi:MAG: hypothetical protein IT368_10095, partial [Candidatus Hydrogenedentes bacterium]|nr:hypothetical protein [Candidatus Hydrogenedentota bacterium]
MMMRSCMVLSYVLALAVLQAAAGIAAPDTYEPDDTVALAKPLPVATTQTRTIFPQGDVDWVSLSVPGPSLIAVEVETNDSEPPILLTTASGRPVTLTPGGDGSGFSRVQAVLTAGTYYLRVNSEDNLAVGSYRIAQGQWTAAESTPEYRFARLWPLEQQRQDFSNIGAITVTEDASVLITENDFDVVQKFTQDGQFLSQFGPGTGSPGRFDDAGGITTVFNGDVLVSDTGNNQIERFNATGAYQTTWNIGGVPGGPGEPRGITSLFDVDLGLRVFVADPVTGQILSFNNVGAIVNTFTAAVAPIDIANDGTNAYFLDPPASSGVVTTLNRNAQSLGSFGFLALPRAITVDENGLILVGNETTTTDGPRLQILRFQPNVSTPDGSFSLSVPLRTGSGAEVAMATDTRGGLYVAEKAAGIISKYQTRLNPPQLVNIWGQNDDDTGRFLRPRGLALAPDGSVVVADSGNSRVQRFTADGQFLDELGTEGSALGQFNLPHDVAVDEDGLVYVIETRNNRVQVLDADLQPIFAFGAAGGGPGQLSAPEGIGLGYTAGGDLLIYVADTGNNRIQLFNENGAWISALGEFGSAVGQFDAPGDVAVGPDGTVYVADSNNARIQRFFPGTEIPAIAWPLGDAARPESLFVAPSGLVYVADAGNNRIGVYSAWGQLLTTLGQRGTAPVQFRAPGGITADGAGGVLVADTFNHRIQEFELRLTPPPVKRAVLVAGAGPFLNPLEPNPIWDPTVNNVNLAYRALRHQGYARDEIRLFTGGQSYDIDGDGVNDDFQMASDDTLDVAFSWLAEADDALFYIIGNSDDGDIVLNQNPEYLTKTKLNILLDKLSAGAVKRALAIIDAPGSGQFLSTAREGTVVVTSCDATGAAYFLTKGTISVSSYFWLGVFNGLSFRQAFLKARTDLADAVQYQVPQFADPTNGDLFEQINFVDENDFREERPVLGNVAPVQVLNLTDSSFDVQVQDITDDGLRLIRVWAIITKPSDVPDNFDPVFNRPHVDLVPILAGAKGGEEDFDGEYTDADEEGVYKVDYFSMDENGNVSQGESGYAVKSGEAPGTMNFTVRRQGTATAITNASVCISPPLVPCEESN